MENQNKISGGEAGPKTGPLPSLHPLPGSRLYWKLEETPETDAIAKELDGSNLREWALRDRLEEHARRLERQRNKFRYRIRQLLRHRGHVAADVVMDKMAADLDSDNNKNK